MLPASMAMPRAGSTVPSTSRVGTWTTKISSEVSVRTLTRMLKPRPKKALVSPFVHQGRFRDGVSDGAEGLSSGMADRGLSRLMVGSWRRSGSAGEGRHGEGGEESGRVGDPAEDPALGGDHVQADPLELGEVRAHAVGQDEGVVAAVVGFADGGVHAYLRGHPGDEELGDPCRAEHILELGRVERALARFVDHQLAGDGRELVDDVVAVLAADEDAAVRTGVAGPL